MTTADADAGFYFKTSISKVLTKTEEQNFLGAIYFAEICFQNLPVGLIFGSEPQPSE